MLYHRNAQRLAVAELDVTVVVMAPAHKTAAGAGEHDRTQIGFRKRPVASGGGSGQCRRREGYCSGSAVDYNRYADRGRTYRAVVRVDIIKGQRIGAGRQPTVHTGA